MSLDLLLRMPPGLFGDEDATPPTCVITTNAVEPVAAGEYFTITFTFDEDVTGFVVGDITIAGATLSEFTTISASVYTVKATVT